MVTVKVCFLPKMVPLRVKFSGYGPSICMSFVWKCTPTPHRVVGCSSCNGSFLFKVIQMQNNTKLKDSTQRRFFCPVKFFDSYYSTVIPIFRIFKHVTVSFCISHTSIQHIITDICKYYYK